MKSEKEVKALFAGVQESIDYVQSDIARIKSATSGYTYDERNVIIKDYECVLNRLFAKREILGFLLDSTTIFA